jgi:hypothetical protein
VKTRDTQIGGLEYQVQDPRVWEGYLSTVMLSDAEISVGRSVLTDESPPGGGLRACRPEMLLFCAPHPFSLPSSPY